MTDEEAHAIAALLRGNSTIAELNLRGNEVGEFVPPYVRISRDPRKISRPRRIENRGGGSWGAGVLGCWGAGKGGGGGRGVIFYFNAIFKADALPKASFFAVCYASGW